MSHRTGWVVGRVALVSLCVAASLCLGAAATALGANAGSSPSAAPKPSAPEVEVYANTFKVSKGVAEERLEAQTKAAEADIVGELEQGLGEDFAGVWFDHETGKFVVPMATAGKSRAEGEGRKAAAARELSAMSLAGDYRTRAVQSSWSELEAAQAQIDEKLSGFFEEKVVQTSLDPEVNAVVVHVRSSAPKEKVEAIESLVKGAGVKVDIREIGDKAFDIGPQACEIPNKGTRLCTQPMRGGVRIWGYLPGTNEAEICSAAFRANGNDGKKYILTAGHCANPSNPAWEWITSWGGYNQFVGTMNQWHYPGKDWAKIDATGSWADTPPWPTMIAAWDEPVYGPNHEYPIYGEASSYKQELVCHSGATSGTSCGQVTDLNKTIEYSGGIKLNSMTEVKGYELCSLGGDSGGPWFPLAGHVALGIHSGGYTGCPMGNLWPSYYSEIKNATAELGVNIAGPGAPEAITGSATSTQLHQATFYGQVRPNKLSTNYRFEWGEGCYCGHSTESSAGSGEGTVGVSKTATGLKGNTTYQYRVRATNSLNTAYGAKGTFTTPAWKPLITPESPTEVKAGHGVLNAQVNPQGTSTHYHFEWGKASEGFPNSVPVTDANVGAGTSNVAVHQEVTGLKGLTEYHFRVVATNEDGTTTSNPQTFTTPDWRPTVTTEKQTGVKVEEEEGQATLHGKVNPKGFDTDYHFEWGDQAEFEAEEYNHSTPEVEAGSGEEDVPVEATIKGIKGQTTYHFRLVAENVEGKSPEPEDLSFATPDWRPLVSHRAAKDVGGEDATLVAWINPEGFATTYHIEWGTQNEYEAGEYNHEVEGGPIGSGTKAVEIEAPLSGLELLVTYHFRVIAENSEGSRDPGDSFFKVPAAVGFVATSYPAVLEGAPVGQFGESFGGLSINCEGPHFEVDLEAGTKAFAASSSEGMICEDAFESHEWEMNGCHLEFEAGHGDLSGSEGEFGIGPPGCGPITTDLASCSIEIPSQTGYSATFANEGEGGESKFSAGVSINDLQYTEVSGIGCTGGSVGGLWGAWEVQAKEGGVKVTPAFESVPVVHTEGASGVTANGATLHGAVNTLTAPAVWGFEYGLEAAEEYESIASGGFITGGIEGPRAKQVTVGSLLPNHTYHYRVDAGTEGGLAKGEDRTFTTAVPHPAGFAATEYPATVAGADTAAVDFEIPAAERAVECETAQLNGSLPSVTAELALSPTYEGCETSGEPNEWTAIEPNSCRLAFGVAGSAPPYEGGLSVQCEEEGDGFEVVTMGGLVTLEVGPQSAGGSLGYEGQGSGAAATIVAQGSGTGLAYTCEPEFFCEIAGIPLAGEDGVLAVDASLGAKDAAEQQAGLFFEGPSEAGLFMAGEGGAEGDEPRFTATEYPATVTGADTAAVDFEIPAAERAVECETAQLNGSLPSVTAELALSPTYEGCETSGEPNEWTAIEPNSCRLAFGVAGSAPPYEGGLSVQCEEEGDGFEVVTMGGLVTLEVGPQSAGGSLGYEGQGSGAAATIVAQGSGTGLAYTCEPEFFCEIAGIPLAGEDGVLAVDASLGGTYYEG
jgi:hypothetical protein